MVCDVVPDGMDMAGWLGVGWIDVLLSGFYLWYWPGVKRWARALSVRVGKGSFSFNMSLHKAIGFVVWIPLLVVAFTGIAFAFPNPMSWYTNASPAHRDFFLWTPPEDAVSEPVEGQEAMTADEALAIMEERYPSRRVNYFETPEPEDPTGTYWAWVTRGFDPWTREGGAGNTYLAIDAYSGETLYDGTPEEGNVFDQAWQDWNFPLHAGDFLGTFSRVLWVLLALSPLVLAVTGIWMNLIRRKKRHRARQRRKEREDDAPPVEPAFTEVDSMPEPVISG